MVSAEDSDKMPIGLGSKVYAQKERVQKKLEADTASKPQ
jgi:hypothetical protein